MTPEISSKNPLKAEHNLRLNNFQGVRYELHRVQKFTYDFQEDSSLFSNKLAKHLNQSNIWKLSATKLSAGTFSTVQLKAEKNMRPNYFQSF